MLPVHPELVELFDEYKRQMHEALVSWPYNRVEQLQKDFIVLLDLTLHKIGTPRLKHLKPRPALPPDIQEVKITEISQTILSLLPTSPDSLNPNEIREHFIPSREYDHGIWIGDGATVDPSVRLVAPVLIGKGCHVCADSILICACIAKTWIGQGVQPVGYSEYIEGPSITFKVITGFCGSS